MDTEALRHLEAAFRLLDVDGSGFIEEPEGLAIGRALGFTQPRTFWEELCKMDWNLDQRVSLEEFLDALKGLSSTAAMMLKIDLDARRAKFAIQAQSIEDASFITAQREPHSDGCAPPRSPVVKAAVQTPCRSLELPRVPCQASCLDSVQARVVQLRSTNVRRQAVADDLQREIESQRADTHITQLEGKCRYMQLFAEALQSQVAQYAEEKAERARKRAMEDAMETASAAPTTAEPEEQEGLITDVR